MGGYSQNFWIGEFRFRVGVGRPGLSGYTGFFRNAGRDWKGILHFLHSKLGLRDKKYAVERGTAIRSFVSSVLF